MQRVKAKARATVKDRVKANFRTRRTLLPTTLTTVVLPAVRSPRRASVLLASFLLLLLSAPLYSQTNPGVSASELLRRAVNGELKAQSEDHTHWMYRVKSTVAGKEEVKLVVESKDGELDRLESVNGSPITAEQELREQQRIQNLVHSPERQKKRQRAQSEDADQTERMFKVLPDALTVRYGERNRDLVQLLFEPNPHFHAWSREAIVFHEMEGQIWVNTSENRLAEIQGHLVRTVKFAGGLLGHLDKGGEFNVRQAEVAPGHWEVTLLHVNMHGKILFLKTISEQQHEVRTDYRQVPSDLTLAQAAEELVKESALKSAQGGQHRAAKRGDVAIAVRKQ
jgi:hypothetical protein